MDTIHSFLENSAAIFPDKEALIDGDRVYTFSELNKAASGVSTFLIQNCPKKSVVSFLLDNSPEFLIVYFGILKSGCIAHIIPGNVSDDNLSLQIKEVDPRFIISKDKYLTKLQRILMDDKFLHVNTILEHKLSSQKEVEVYSDEVSTIIYSSGTTSRPKGVKLEHRNVVQATNNMVEYLKINEDDRYLNVLPLFHSFGLGNVHMLWRQSGSVILAKNSIDIPGFINNIIKNKATIFAAVPATFRMILDHCKDKFSECTNLRLMVTNSTYIPPETTSEVLKILPNTDFYTYYGLTEASRSTFNHFNNSLNKLKSVGQAAPNVNIKIVDQNGNVCSSNKQGEISIAGDHVIREYWKNKIASGAIKDLWIYTGDVGYFDEEGYLYLTGRKDDVINVSGEKVSPVEIEQILNKMPGVCQSAIVAAQDRILGQIIKAFIVKEDIGITESEVMSYCKVRLARYKVPKEIIFVEKIPTTDSGKIKRSLLRN